MSGLDLVAMAAFFFILGLRSGIALMDYREKLRVRIEAVNPDD